MKAYYDDEPIYWKGKNEEKKMLQVLNDKIKESDYHKQCTLFPDLYELFSLNLLQSKYKPDLVHATQLLSDSFFGNLEHVLRSLRPILESTLYKLDEIDNTLLKTDCFYREKIDLHKALFHLAGRPKPVGEQIVFDVEVKIPLHVYYLADNLRKITNVAAMHHYDPSSSKSLVKAMIFGLFEYLMWFKNFSKQNYINN